MHVQARKSPQIDPDDDDRLDGPATLQAAAALGFDARAFRAEVRAFCREQMPPDIARMAARHQYFSREQRVRWQQRLQARGWFAAHWPRAHGGQDWSHLQRLILIEELERAGTPWIAHFGVSFLGPVLCAFGDDGQRARFLPGILDSTTWWAQGFSEPGAGSDLGSVALRAEGVPGGYRVNGQKTWTTMAHWADMIFCLARTGHTERRSDGISFLLVDLNAPGVTVRPIETFDACHHVNEVFFEDVEVPAANLVGREGQGWAIARFIVERERLLVTEIGKAQRLLNELHHLAARATDGDRPVSASATFRRHAALLEVRYRTLRDMVYGSAIAADEGRGHPIDPSLLKIRGSELQQAVLDAIVDVLGRDGLAFQVDGIERDLEGYGHGDPRMPGLVSDHLHARATSIYGGSNEIQRGIIAKALLQV
ncbi:MAG TPA: acyl-CoA dehydrogenase family protein [Nevskiaceae bacterium]|nr:acyl-CoA dehydrogenase family protein [Nevskiaceae bacterium]